MRKLVAVNSVTLDGVMQSPGRPDEDTRDGFTRGGWASPYHDEESAAAMAPHLATSGALLLGRRTYDDFYAYWPKRPDEPYSRVLTDTRKYVVSRTRTELPWRNSTLISPNGAETVSDAIAKLKAGPGKDLVVLGSGELLRSLPDLVDEWLLLIHPLVLGAGRRLFPDRGPVAGLRLADTVTTGTGLIMATYRRTER